MHIIGVLISLPAARVTHEQEPECQGDFKPKCLVRQKGRLRWATGEAIAEGFGSIGLNDNQARLEFFWPPFLCRNMDLRLLITQFQGKQKLRGWRERSAVKSTDWGLGLIPGTHMAAHPHTHMGRRKGENWGSPYVHSLICSHIIMYSTSKYHTLNICNFYFSIIPSGSWNRQTTCGVGDLWQWPGESHCGKCCSSKALHVPPAQA